MRILNTTPHNINVVKVNGGENVYPKSTCQIRATAHEEKVGVVEDIEIFREELGSLVIEDPDNLLTEADILIMSRIAATKAKDSGFFKKYTIWIPGGLLRDPMGGVIGCKGMIEV